MLFIKKIVNRNKLDLSKEPRSRGKHLYICTQMLWHNIESYRRRCECVLYPTAWSYNERLTRVHLYRGYTPFSPEWQECTIIIHWYFQQRFATAKSACLTDDTVILVFSSFTDECSSFCYETYRGISVILLDGIVDTSTNQWASHPNHSRGLSNRTERICAH
jgi:hypothetical protein